MANNHSARAEKVYVKVNSDFDSTGYIQPKSITWADGRTFKIEKVKDYRPAATFRPGFAGACYTVMIRGEEKHLFLNGRIPLSPAGLAGGLWRRLCRSLSWRDKTNWRSMVWMAKKNASILPSTLNLFMPQ